MTRLAPVFTSTRIALVVFALGGCSGSVDAGTANTNVDTGADGIVDPGVDGSIDAPRDTSVDDTAETSDGTPVCPSSAPVEGAPCADGLHCTFPPPAGPCDRTPLWADCRAGKWSFVCVALPPPRDTGVTDSGAGCPATVPTGGMPCAPIGRECGYGDDPRPYCHPKATCTSSGFVLSATPCDSLPPASCPPTASAANGTACTVASAFCAYEDSTCGCTNCSGGPCGGAYRWACSEPPTDPACPTKMPNLGTSCTGEGLTCAYGACAIRTREGRICKGGVWIDDPLACPL